MSKYDTFKNILEATVSASVGLVVGQVIAKNTPAGLNKFQTYGMRLGTLVIGSTLSNLASKNIIGGLDKFVGEVKENVEAAEAEKAEADGSFQKLADEIFDNDKTEGK